MKNADKEKIKKLMNDLYENKEVFAMYFASLLSESLTREECEKKLVHLNMLEDYFSNNNNTEWVHRIEFTKAVLLEDLTHLL